MAKMMNTIIEEIATVLAKGFLEIPTEGAPVPSRQ